MKNSFSVSMNCYTWGKFDIAECLTQIKNTPLRMVELPAEQIRPNSLIPELMVDAPLGGEWRYSLPDLKQLLDSGGFKVESLDVFGYIGYPGGAEIVKRRIDFARTLGAEIIVLGCHHEALVRPSGILEAAGSLAEKEARAFLYALLREVGDYAAERDIRIALEIHGGIMANAAEALRTMQEVNRENVGINFDTANILFYNETLSAAEAANELEAVAPYVFHVHLKDILRGETSREHILPPLGRGEVDFPTVFNILHAANFYGPFSFEVETFHGATQSEDISDYHADLLASIEYIKSLGELNISAWGG